MEYIGNVIRPPSEADSIILQVTVGCSHNKCTFCGAYKDIPFALKTEEAIRKDLEFAEKYCRRQKRVFLADGDVLILSQKKLVRIFHLIKQHLPWVSRISLYGNAKAVRHKSLEDLHELKNLGLDRVYMGLESGHDEILLSVKKKETSATMIEAARKINATGLFLSVTALLGLGGVTLSKAHALCTAKTLTAMKPQQIAILTLMPLANTELGEKVIDGEFSMPSPEQLLIELSEILENLGNFRCQFHANHASSYLPLVGRWPRDKESLLHLIRRAQRGEIKLTPDAMRAL